MTGPLPRGVIGYRRGNNVVLRYALYELWRSRCHVCEEPKQFADTHIDHIIPESTSAQQLRYLITQHGLPADFHLHRPANLALVCAKDNTRKGSRLLSLDSRAMTVLLTIAREREAEVDRRVQQRTSADAVTRGLVKATATNLNMAESRDAFLCHAPAVVQALALLDEDRVGGYTTVRHLHLPPDDQYVRVYLDARGRAALSVIEEICGSSLNAALQAGVPRLKTSIGERVAAYFHAGDPTVTTYPFVVTISGIDFRRHRTTVTVEMTGRAIGEAHAVIPVSDPAGHAEQMIMQDRYADVKSAFRLDIRWDLSAKVTSLVKVAIEVLDVNVDELQVWDEPARDDSQSR